MVRGVAGRREGLPAERRRRRRSGCSRSGHRRELAPERVERVAVEAARRAPRAATGRRGAARRPRRPRRSAPGARARSRPAAPAWSRWMCESSRWRMSPSSRPCSRRPSLQPRERRRRAAVEERGPVGRLDHVDADRALEPEERQVDRLEHAARQTRAARAGDGDERGLEVGEQVADRLDPDREADEVARRRERRVGGRGVRHARRVLDQALDAAERLGEQEELRPRRRARPPPPRTRRGTRPCRRSRASGARATSWPGMGREAGVEHALDGRVRRRGRRRSRARSRSAGACAARAS